MGSVPLTLVPRNHQSSGQCSYFIPPGNIRKHLFSGGIKYEHWPEMG